MKITWNEEKQDWDGFPEYQPIPDQEELDRHLATYGIAVIYKGKVVSQDEWRSDENVCLP